MKAIVCTKYGPPDVLRLREVEKPTPKADEVLVKVHAVSVNSWDWDLLRGVPFANRIGGFLKPKYAILGADIAGIIEEAGRSARRFRTGDEVFGDVSGSGWGGFAEYVCVPENLLALKSSDMSFEQAAAVPQAGVLALQGLSYGGRLRSGQEVLINGAGGGVGTFAVQIAKSFGADVTGVDRTDKLKMVRAIGADRVLDYTREDFADTGRRYDLILDVAANRSVVDYKRALYPKGVFVMIGGSTSAFFQTVFLGTLLSVVGRNKMGILLHKPNPSDLVVLNELFEAGKLVPVIDRCYSLSEVPEAFRYFGGGHAQGKIVISVDHGSRSDE
jgi:NADPH:quinone reductase-like Zn-dependent oxidoreductase